MSIITDLQETRELIADEERWTQASYARNAKGETCAAVDDEACKWCVLGALRKVTGYDPRTLISGPKSERFTELEVLLYHQQEGFGPVFVNDTLGHSATIEMLDTAIADAKGRA